MRPAVALVICVACLVFLNSDVDALLELFQTMLLGLSIVLAAELLRDPDRND